MKVIVEYHPQFEEALWKISGVANDGAHCLGPILLKDTAVREKWPIFGKDGRRSFKSLRESERNQATVLEALERYWAKEFKEQLENAA